MSRVTAWLKHLVRRRRGLGLTAVAVSTALIAQGSIVTNAAWQDTEWNHATVGTLDCAQPEGKIASRAEGRLLSGSLLNIDLDNIAEAKGVETTHNGQRSIPAPQTAPLVGEHAYAHPLNVEALNLLDLDLTNVLDIPLDTQTAAVAQYAQAKPDGQAVGAAGAVADDGGIALEVFDGEVPDLATLELSTLLNSIDFTGIELGTLLEDVADLELNIGAVAGRAWMDGCRDAWGIDGAVTREYMTSHLDLDLTSDVVGALGTTVDQTVSTLQTTASELIGDQSLLSSTLAGLNPVLQTVFGLVNIVTGTLGVRIDTSADVTGAVTAVELDLTDVNALLTEPFGDGVISITLADGLVSIDTVALMSAAYPETYDAGLNGLPPNTNPLQDEYVLEILLQRLSSTLSALITEIQETLTGVVGKSQVEVQLTIPVQECTAWLLVCTRWENLPEPDTGIAITIQGTVNQLLQNEGDVVVDLALLEVLLPGLGNVLDGLVGDIVEELLAGGVLPLIGGVIEGALTTAATLPSGVLEDVGQPIVGLVGSLYEQLFLNNIVAVSLNAQNDPTAGADEPQDWELMDPGRYDVAALRVGVLDAAGNSAVWLYLGRGSVGPPCFPTELSPACAQY